MFSYRVTKYDPRNRNSKGIYLKSLEEEWTSYSDIGKIFENKVLNYEDYLKVENAYIKAVLLFMDCLSLKTLSVGGLEKRRRPLSSEFSDLDLQVFDTLRNKKRIDKKRIPSLMRLILREKGWCRLESPRMYVHFGYEYYMFIGSTKLCTQVLEAIKKMGLFVEDFESPCHPTEE